MSRSTDATSVCISNSLAQRLLSFVALHGSGRGDTRLLNELRAALRSPEQTQTAPAQPGLPLAEGDSANAG